MSNICKMDYYECEALLLRSANNTFPNSSDYDYSNSSSYNLNSSNSNFTNLLSEIEDSIQKALEYGNDVRMPMNYTSSKEIWKNLELTHYFKIFAYAVAIVGGLLGNVSVILTVLLNKSMWKTTINLYVANLAVADALICIFCMLPHALKVATAEVYILGKIMCKLNTFTEMTSLICSVLTLSAISWNTRFAVASPIERITSKQRISILLSVMWIISIVVSSPLLLVKKHVVIQWLDFTECQCGEEWPIYWYIDETAEKCVSRQILRLTYYVCVLTTLYFVPVVLMVVSYSSVVWTLRMASIDEKQNSATIEAHSRRLKVVTKRVFLLLIAFIVCWTPIQVIVMHSAFIPNDSESVAVSESIVDIQWASHFLAYANSLINPIIYGAFNRSFRDGFCNILKCTCTRNGHRLSGVSGQMILTRLRSSVSQKLSKSLNSDNKTTSKSNIEMKFLHPVEDRCISPTAGDYCAFIKETEE